MKVSIIGTGRMGNGLAKILSTSLGASVELLWGSRSVEKVERFIANHAYQRVKPVSTAEALDADVIVPALWFRDLIPWVREHKEKLSGKIMIDIINPFTEDFNDFTTEWGTSASEELQKLIPDTKVVGAFKNTFFRVLESPVYQDQVSDIYVTSDDEEAKKTVMQLLQPIPFRIWDGGSLSNNRTIERMTLFEREVSIRYGTYPYVSFRMFGLKD